MRRLAVVIVNYRTPELTLGALASLAGELDRDRDRALVVDNASGDGSAEVIEAAIHAKGWREWARVIRSPDNGGFSAGNNVGLAAESAEFYLLLNSDAYVRPGAIAELLRAAGGRARAGIVSPRLEWPDGTAQISCFRFRSPASELIEAAGTSVVTRLLSRWDVPLPVSDAPLSPAWTSFACVLLHREVLETLGPMDDGYFMYFDDVDYCRRAWRSGFEVLHWPAARVVHLRGGTSPLKAAIAARRPPPPYYYHSRARYFAKFYGRYGLWFANLAWWAGRTVSLLRETFGAKQAHTCEGAGRDIWRHSLDPFASLARTREEAR
ncbi:MAG: glycosyltransferase family 2 protein [Deltaproteobacteria bacterium]|nr:glycosyltransferase family 2 protein [Deltaproteobacteria bacterium]